MFRTTFSSPVHEAVRVVVRGVDAPGVASMGVGDVTDAVGHLPTTKPSGVTPQHEPMRKNNEKKSAHVRKNEMLS